MEPSVPVRITNANLPNGPAILDSSGKLPSSVIPGGGGGAGEELFVFIQAYCDALENFGDIEQDNVRFADENVNCAYIENLIKSGKIPIIIVDTYPLYLVYYTISDDYMYCFFTGSDTYMGPENLYYEGNINKREMVFTKSVYNGEVEESITTTQSWHGIDLAPSVILRGDWLSGNVANNVRCTLRPYECFKLNAIYYESFNVNITLHIFYQDAIRVLPVYKIEIDESNSRPVLKVYAENPEYTFVGGYQIPSSIDNWVSNLDGELTPKN